MAPSLYGPTDGENITKRWPFAYDAVREEPTYGFDEHVSELLIVGGLGRINRSLLDLSTTGFDIRVRVRVSVGWPDHIDLYFEHSERLMTTAERFEFVTSCLLPVGGEFRPSLSVEWTERAGLACLFSRGNHNKNLRYSGQVVSSEPLR